MAHPTLYVSATMQQHAFADVTDAIQAVAAFQAASLGFHEYNITSYNPACPLTGYSVRVRTNGNDSGWLCESS